MRIVGEYVLSIDEYAHAMKVIRSYRRPYAWVLATAFGVFGIVQIIRGYLGPGEFCLALVPVYLMAVPFEIKRAKASLERRQDRVSVTATFTDETFATQSVKAAVELRWAALVKAVETPESFLIYATKRSAVIVPKRAFSPADVAQLSAFLRMALPGSR